MRARQISPEVPRTSLMGKVTVFRVARGLLMTLWSHENLNWFPYIDFRGFDASGAWLIARFASFDADGFWREFQWGLVPSAFRGGGALQRLLEKHSICQTSCQIEVLDNRLPGGEDGSFIEVFTRFLTKVSISVYFPLKVLGAFLVALRGMSARVPFALETILLGSVLVCTIWAVLSKGNTPRLGAIVLRLSSTIPLLNIIVK
ncbi:hypothetical protein D9757_015314 [Collybiopsis confluens]|uniref:Uncharacterized protein n=1 Tax=Collybiopsis confluens TaxID=2823264 RepID=A0A8H5CIS4_9AGAR|nr:hypothetical protein D9757_015314 [Collybiopsis confluens]